MNPNVEWRDPTSRTHAAVNALVTDVHRLLEEMYLVLFRRYAERSGQVACILHHDERLLRRPCRRCGAAV